MLSRFGFAILLLGFQCQSFAVVSPFVTDCAQTQAGELRCKEPAGGLVYVGRSTDEEGIVEFQVLANDEVIGQVTATLHEGNESANLIRVGYREGYGYGYGHGYGYARPAYRPVAPLPPPLPPPAYAPAPYFVAPIRPASCGQYRYWNGQYCADARWERPYLGPRW